MRLLFFFLFLSLCLFTGNGCVSSRVIENTRVPEIEIDAWGDIRFHNEKIQRGKLVHALRRAGIRKDQEINILVPAKNDRRLMGLVAGELSRGGFSRTIFVTKPMASSSVHTYRGPQEVKHDAVPYKQRTAPTSHRRDTSQGNR